MGRRDYAILTMLARPGLRAGEVATLTLDDIDWRSGEMLIRAKGRQRAREIGQLLRHESHDTTRVYAKVDIEALRTLSPSWPGGAL